MTLRLCVILAALAVVSGCATDSGSSAELTVVRTATPTMVAIAQPAATFNPEPATIPNPEPTGAPTPGPSMVPTTEPTTALTVEPSEAPTPEPTEMPTAEPTAPPTPVPLSRDEVEGRIYSYPGGPGPPGDCDSSADEVASQAVVVGKLQWSPDGSQILFTDSGKEHGSPVYAVEADGSQMRRVEDMSGAISYFDLSADGSRIAYSTCAYAADELDDDYEIAVSNIDGTETQRLTENTNSEFYPIWSPDGTRVAFAWRIVRRPTLSVYMVATSELIDSPINVRFVAPIPPVWSPDGRSIAFVAYANRPERDYNYWSDLIDGARVDVYAVGPDGSGLRRIVWNAVSAPSWSPDGERIAVAVSEGDGAALYTFAADGSESVMVNRIAAKDIVYRIPQDSDPVAFWVPNVSWSPDGSKIMYGALSVVNVGDGSVVLDTQLIRFEWVGNYGARSVDYENAGAFPLAAWSPDGSRIAVLAPVMPALQLGYAELEQGYPSLYTINSDGKGPNILVGRKEGGMAAWPLPVRPPADVEACPGIVPNPGENTGLIEDCRTLLGMRDRLAGSGTLAWSSDTPVSSWLGVGVSGGRVRTLHISDFPLQGELYGQVPLEIGNLEGLEELIIESTHINGPIPSEIGKLANLESLEVAFTHMGGSIPAEIGNLTNLKRLILTDSQFSGSIPAEIGGLANLESLVLRNNNLSGHIPPEIGNLTNLRFLDVTGRDIWKDNSGMHGNLITGLIPSEMGNMVSLEQVLLFGNRLTGRIPADLGNLSNLTGLYLEGNELSGCIPKALQALRDTDIHRLLLRYCE